MNDDRGTTGPPVWKHVVMGVIALSLMAAGRPVAIAAASTPAARPITPRTAPDGALGSFAPLGSGFDSVVYALALKGDDTLYAGGEFTTAVGLPSGSLNKIAAWDDTWVPLGSGSLAGLNNLVSALAVKGDDTLYVGGLFTAAAGGTVGTLNRIAAWDDTWIPLGTGASNGLNDWVRALAVRDDDTVYAGGHFTAATGGGANSLNKVAAWDDTWFALGVGASQGLNNTVRSMTVLRDDTLYVSGQFTALSGGAANSLRYVASWDDTWATIGGGSGGGVNSPTSATAVLRDDTVIFGGGFNSTTSGTAANAIVARTPAAWSAFVSAGRNGLNSYIDAIVTDDTHGLVYVGGGFTGPHGGATGSLNYVAAWDVGIRAWIPFTVTGGSNGVTTASVGGSPNVVALALDDTQIYLGGNFTTAGGVPGFGNIARWSWDRPQGSHASTAEQGASVQVQGEGFIGVPPTGAVTVAGTPVAYTRDDSTHLTLTIPSSIAVGTHDIDVYGVGGWGEVGSVTVTAAPSPAPTPVPAGAPTSVSAVAGNASAIVTWTAPEFIGSFPISTYQVTSAPAAGTCLVAAPTTQCVVPSLRNGVAYTFTVRALTGAGWGADSSASDPVTPEGPAVPSIVITGMRDPIDSRYVLVNGTSSGLTGRLVKPWVSKSAGGGFSPGATSRLVAGDGSFDWRRRSAQTISVYFAYETVRSNTVTINNRRRSVLSTDQRR